MTEFLAGQFDIAVIGAGHAGIEAALAAARLGMETIVFTINLDAVGNHALQPRYRRHRQGPSGPGAGRLGGEMAKRRRVLHPVPAAEQGKGPRRLVPPGPGGPAALSGVHEAHPGAAGPSDGPPGRGGGGPHGERRGFCVVLATGAVFSVKAVILATGTYLAGRTIVGECVEESGPDGMHAAGRLTDSLLKLGLPLRRFKTGTPPRVNARSVDFDEMELQRRRPASPLFIRHPIPAGESGGLLAHLDHGGDAPDRPGESGPGAMYSGVIEGVGPRYCPSFETKVVRFPDKLRHQLFVEPMGLNTEELYIQGFSSSMPEEVQIRMLAACRACAMP